MTAKRKTVLVVDDSITVQKVVELALRDTYRVLCASEGARGLELAKAEHPDLILVDYQMPGMYGNVFCKKLREIPELCEARLVLISAKSDSIGYYFEHVVGIEHRLQKPFDVKELRRVATALLDGADDHAEAGPKVGEPTAPTVERQAPPPAAEAPAASPKAPTRAPAAAAAVPAEPPPAKPVAPPQPPPPPPPPPQTSTAPPSAPVAEPKPAAVGCPPADRFAEFGRLSLPELVRAAVRDSLGMAGLGDATEGLVLRSPLRQLTLPDALSFACHHRLTGNIALLGKGVFGEVFVEDGLFAFARATRRGEPSPLADVMFDPGETASLARRILRGLGGAAPEQLAMGRALVEAGAVSASAWRDSLEQHSRRALAGLLDLADGTLCLRTHPLPGDVLQSSLRLPTMQVLMDSLRLVDERDRARRAFADRDVVLFQIVDDGQVGRLTEAELAILGLVDGQRPLEQLLDATDQDPDEVLRTCFRLLQVGVLRRREGNGAAPEPVANG